VHRRHPRWASGDGGPSGEARNLGISGLAYPLRYRPRVMNTIAPPTAAASPLASSLGYHGAVSDFKRQLIEATLHQMRGNRTHTARALGLQRTYLLRLIRELGVTAPPPPPRRRSPTG
jgi:DNA-binding NtrC family response regulator